MPVAQETYQGIDWRQQRQWNCPGASDALTTGPMPTLPMSPFDLLFVRVDAGLVKQEDRRALAALAFDTNNDPGDVVSPAVCHSLP